MTSVLLHTLNHYPEFQSNAGINGIIAYVNSLPLAPGARVFPAHINTNAQRARYHQKFGNNFVVVGAIQLFYRPSPRINLEVVRPQNHFCRIKCNMEQSKTRLRRWSKCLLLSSMFSLFGYYKSRNHTILTKQRRLSNREKFQENGQ